MRQIVRPLDKLALAYLRLQAREYLNDEVTIKKAVERDILIEVLANGVVNFADFKTYLKAKYQKKVTNKLLEKAWEVIYKLCNDAETQRTISPVLPQKDLSKVPWNQRVILLENHKNGTQIPAGTTGIVGNGNRRIDSFNYEKNCPVEVFLPEEYPEVIQIPWQKIGLVSKGKIAA